LFAALRLAAGGLPAALRLEVGGLLAGLRLAAGGLPAALRLEVGGLFAALRLAAVRRLLFGLSFGEASGWLAEPSQFAEWRLPSDG
jgi:hypothetical protein